MGYRTKMSAPSLKLWAWRGDIPCFEKSHNLFLYSPATEPTRERRDERQKREEEQTGERDQSDIGDGRYVEMREIGEDFVQRLKNGSFCHVHVRRNLDDFFKLSENMRSGTEKNSMEKKKFKLSMAGDFNRDVPLVYCR